MLLVMFAIEYILMIYHIEVNKFLSRNEEKLT